MSMIFLFNDTATTEIYTYGHTLSLHDALPISTGKFLLFARQVHLFRTGSVRIQKILRKPNHLWATGIEQRCLHHMTRKNDPQRGGIGGHLTQLRPDRKSVV